MRIINDQISLNFLNFANSLSKILNFSFIWNAVNCYLRRSILARIVWFYTWGHTSSLVAIRLDFWKIAVTIYIFGQWIIKNEALPSYLAFNLSTELLSCCLPESKESFFLLIVFTFTIYHLEPSFLLYHLFNFVLRRQLDAGIGTGDLSAVGAALAILGTRMGKREQRVSKDT